MIKIADGGVSGQMTGKIVLGFQVIAGDFEQNTLISSL
jgi:hypothetical protein